MKVSTLLNVLPIGNHDLMFDVRLIDGHFVTGLTREDLEDEFLNSEVEYILPSKYYACCLAFEIYLKGDY